MPNTKKDTIRIPVVLEPHTKSVLENMAKHQGRSLNNLINFILSAYVDGVEQNIYKMLENNAIEEEDDLIGMFLIALKDSYNKKMSDQITLVMAETGSTGLKKNKETSQNDSSPELKNTLSQ